MPTPVPIVLLKYMFGWWRSWIMMRRWDDTDAVPVIAATDATAIVASPIVVLVEMIQATIAGDDSIADEASRSISNVLYQIFRVTADNIQKSTRTTTSLPCLRYSSSTKKTDTLHRSFTQVARQVGLDAYTLNDRSFQKLFNVIFISCLFMKPGVMNKL